jgi:organic radical activating enzyme
MATAQIKEIFTSIQGEGHLVGYTQLFIRFCKCDFNCKNCDTDYKPDTTCDTYTANSLAERLKSYDTKNVHSICLTGGEALMEVDFLKEFLRNVSLPVYLETNAAMPEAFEEIVNMIKYVSANLKLPSATGCEDCFDRHAEFLRLCKRTRKDFYIKVPFDENITDYEIDQCVKMAKENDVEIVLQPITKNGKIIVPNRFMPDVLERFRQKYWNVRLIPQVHKILSVR